MIYKSHIAQRAEELRGVIYHFASRGDTDVHKQLYEDCNRRKLPCVVEYADNIPNRWVPYKKQLIVTPGNGSISTIEAVCYQLLTFPEQLFVIPSGSDQIGIDFLTELTSRGWPVDFLVPRSEGLSTFGEHLRKQEAAGYFDPDLAILYGSDDTIRSYEAQLGGHCRVVKYGSKTSIGVHVMCMDDFKMRDYAKLYASDFFRFNGTGCLNTSALYILSEDTPLEQYRPWLSEIVEERSKWMEFPSWSTSAKLQANMIKSEATFYQERGVFLRSTSGDIHTLGQGKGTAVVVVCNREEMMLEWAQRSHLLSSATLAVSSNDDKVLTSWFKTLYEMGVSRITSPGQAQDPSWRWKHDGLPLIPVWGREVGID